MCHGAGGLQAQYRFGARTGLAPIILGVVVLVLAVGFANHAAALFSIIPGGGHLYLGQPFIAAAALSWNGLFGYALYDSIARGQVGVAVVLGVFESLWYFGTLFGAVSGAHKYNRDAVLNALDELRSQFDDRPESWPPAPPVSGPAR